ncbi:MAG: TerC/Alx family metal homeostasis membrane protein [Chloroflexi bacterium]|nr:TerC/Alx family metal homeostasis membrane protein [Chloroflexota bacterium]MDA1281415.1 TerC/Alx family metal homeostasis membrane protein [Chloroflexota bacterium]
MLETFNHWLIFNVALVLLLVLDFLVLSRRSHEVGMKEAAWLTLFWTLVAGVVGVWVYTAGNSQQGLEYVTGYVAERALSIDNLFVFIVIFGYFNLPKNFQAKGLLWGIIGALLARAVFIGIGVAVITAFSWFLFILGAFLIYTAYKLAFAGEQEVDPSKNITVRLFRKFMPVSTEYDGTKFFTKINGVRAVTPFLLVVLVLGTTDIVFAIDSIPTVFGITDDPFIVWTSNAMAVLGMRPLFFLLVGMVKLFRFLQYGLAAILGFVGLKMIVEEALHDFHVFGEIGDIYLSLGIIVGILAGSVLLSLVLPNNEEEERAHAAVGGSGSDDA